MDYRSAKPDLFDVRIFVTPSAFSDRGRRGETKLLPDSPDYSFGLLFIKYFIDFSTCIVNDGIDSVGKVVGCSPSSSNYHPLFSFTLSFNGKMKFDAFRWTRHRNEQSLRHILYYFSIISSQK